MAKKNIEAVTGSTGTGKIRRQQIGLSIPIEIGHRLHIEATREWDWSCGPQVSVTSPKVHGPSRIAETRSCEHISLAILVEVGHKRISHAGICPNLRSRWRTAATYVQQQSQHGHRHDQGWDSKQHPDLPRE